MDDERNERLAQCFRNTFSSEDGKTVLWWIADQCGMNADRGEQIKPELIAFFNRLLRMGGITHEKKAGRLMDALMDVSRIHIKEDKDEIL